MFSENEGAWLNGKCFFSKFSSDSSHATYLCNVFLCAQMPPTVRTLELCCQLLALQLSLLRGLQAQFLCCSYRDALILFPLHTSARLSKFVITDTSHFLLTQFHWSWRKSQARCFQDIAGHDHSDNATCKGKSLSATTCTSLAEQLDRRPLRKR